jgi:hypothetical protein
LPYFKKNALQFLLMENSFLHQSLTGPSAFRIFVLKPSADTSRIEGDLREAALDDKIAFEALSYTWGDPHFPRSIFLNGYSLKVTESLYQALVQLRLSHKERLLWIDAICINQEDGRDRNHQVAYMHRIYKLATQVLVWLGPKAGKSIVPAGCHPQVLFTY